MSAIAIREAFYAVQGEGSRAGEPSVFLRVAGCNLDCWFCDTDWKYGEKIDVEDITALVASVSFPHKPTWVVVTGGEPCVAPAFDDLVDWLTGHHLRVAVETNGTRWRESLRDCHVVTVSPKEKWEGDAARLDLKLLGLDEPNCNQQVREFKLVVEADDDLEYVHRIEMSLPFEPTHKFLQPVYENRASWENAYRLCLADPTYRLSLQLHKWLGVR